MSIEQYPLICGNCGTRIWWNPVYVGPYPYHRKGECPENKPEETVLNGMKELIERIEIKMGMDHPRGLEPLLLECRNALEAAQRTIAGMEADSGALRNAIIAMSEDGWLCYGEEGMTDAQKLCYVEYTKCEKTKA